MDPSSLLKRLVISSFLSFFYHSSVISLWNYKNDASFKKISSLGKSCHVNTTSKQRSHALLKWLHCKWHDFSSIMKWIEIMSCYDNFSSVMKWTKVVRAWHNFNFFIEVIMTRHDFSSSTVKLLQHGTTFSFWSCAKFAPLAQSQISFFVHQNGKKTSFSIFEPKACSFCSLLSF